MAYDYLPVLVPGPSSINNTDIDFAPCINELWFALRERYWGKGDCNWPPPSRVYTSGVVTGVTETTMTDSSAAFCLAGAGMYRLPIPCIVDSPDSDYNDPTSLYLVIDDPDPVKTVKVHAGSNTATVITMDNIRDYVTSKRIPSLASLVGKPYYLIRGDRGIWSSERLLEWINDYEWAVGTVLSLGATTDDYGTAIPASPTTSFFRDPTKHWKKNEHSTAGREVLLYANDGFLKRVAIASNTSNTITFATQTWTPQTDSPYSIVAAGAMAIPGRGPTYPYAWYRGHREGYLSHDVDNTMTSTLMPSSTVKVPGALAMMCIEFDRPTWDNDFRTEQQIFGDDQICGTPPDKFYAPDFYKTLRGWDVGAENVSYYYTEATSYAGASYIPFINPAETFRLAGVNAFVGITGAVEGSMGNDGTSNNVIAISGITFPFTPIQVDYSITKPNGDYLFGRGYMTASNRLVHENGDLVFSQTDDGPPSIPGVNGRTITIALGFSRFTPREFKRMFRQAGVFIPDIIVDPITGPHVVDPATVADFAMTECLGVGQWVPRGASTKSIERKHESQSYTDAQGFAWEIGDNYVTGQLYRYIGDDYFDPTVYDGSSFIKDDGALLGDYYRRFYMGNVGSLQGLYNRQKWGNVTETSTTKTSIRDVKKDWFNFYWFGGTMRVETGTATSGSTTNLTDSTKADADPTSPTNSLNCMWAVSRFSNTNPYLGFVVEIDEIRTDPTGQPYTVTHRRLITASNPTSVGVTWVEPLPVTASGLVYRIKEPYYFNRYIDRMVKVTHFSNTTGAVIAEETVKITGNSEDTLFFETLSFTPENGDQYEIFDPLFGTVWKWDGAKMVKPTGNDVTRYGVPVQRPFHDDQRENLPHYMLRYGRYMIGDAISSETINERYAFINALLWTIAQGGWTDYPNAAAALAMTPDPVTLKFAQDPESFGISGGSFYTNTLSDFQGEVATVWGMLTSPGSLSITDPFGGDPVLNTASGGAANPSAFTTSRWWADMNYGAAATSNYAYYHVTGIPKCHGLAHGSQFYSYGQINITDDPPSTASGITFQFAAANAPVLYHAWNPWDSAGAGVRDEEYSIKLGNTTLPEWVGLGSGSQGDGGYYVANALVILKWNVAGGFKYVP